MGVGVVAVAVAVAGVAYETLWQRTAPAMGLDPGDRQLVRRGAEVYAADLTDSEVVATPSVTFHEHDVTREESALRLAERVERDHGRLDILVNAAGIEIEKTVEETSLADWNRIFAVNVAGTFLTSKHTLPLMRKAGGGSIINFGSYDGFIADPSLAAYCATKGAVEQLTKALAVELAPRGVRVNCIAPGAVLTPMNAGLRAANPNLHAELSAKIPVGRWGAVEEIAPAAVVAGGFRRRIWRRRLGGPVLGPQKT